MWTLFAVFTCTGLSGLLAGLYFFLKKNPASNRIQFIGSVFIVCNNVAFPLSRNNTRDKGSNSDKSISLRSALLTTSGQHSICMEVKLVSHDITEIFSIM